MCVKHNTTKVQEVVQLEIITFRLVNSIFSLLYPMAYWMGIKEHLSFKIVDQLLQMKLFIGKSNKLYREI